LLFYREMPIRGNYFVSQFTASLIRARGKWHVYVSRVYSILVTICDTGLSTSSARMFEFEIIISSISTLWSRLVDLSLLSTISTCKISVTWLVFLFSNFVSLLFDLSTTMMAITTRAVATTVPISSDNTRDISECDSWRRWTPTELNELWLKPEQCTAVVRPMWGGVMLCLATQLSQYNSQLGSWTLNNCLCVIIPTQNLFVPLCLIS